MEGDAERTAVTDVIPASPLDEVITMTRRELNTLLERERERGIAQVTPRSEASRRNMGYHDVRVANIRHITPEELRMLDGLLKRGHNLPDACAAIGFCHPLGDLKRVIARTGWVPRQRLYACQPSGRESNPPFSTLELAGIETMLRDSDSTISDIAEHFTGHARIRNLQIKLRRSGFYLGWVLERGQMTDSDKVRIGKKRNDRGRNTEGLNEE